MPSQRIEHDLLGEKAVPAEAYYGIQTQRAMENFHITGVPIIDTSVARHLISAVDAAAMLGAQVIITGFSPEAAQTLTQLGLELGQLKTRGSLQAGIEDAFRMTGKNAAIKA